MTGTEAEIQWYIARDGQQYGPITDAEMKLLVESGHLRSVDLVWRPGFAEWRPATAVFPPRQAEPVPAARTAPQAPQNPTTAPQAQTTPSHAAATDPARTQAPQTRNPQGPAQRNFPQPGQAAGPGPAASGPAASGPAAPGSAGMAGTATVRIEPGGTTAGRAAQARPAAAPSNQDARTGSPRSETLGDARGRSTPSSTSSTTSPKSNGPLLRKALIVGGVVAVFGTAGVVAGKNKDALLQLAGLNSSKTPQVPIIKASPATRTKPTETAALQDPTAPPATPPAQSEPAAASPADATSATAATSEPSPVAKYQAALDERYGKSPLWSYVKRTDPDWYNQHLGEAAKIVADGKPELEATRHMVISLVALRRQSADQALSAGAPRLKAIAAAFLDNLQALAGASPATCYGFISQGETSAPVVEILHQSSGNSAIEAQAVAILEAAAEGKSSPQSHERPKKEDYDVLAGQLGKLGWSQADLQMFADPKALSNAEPARVYQMVRDWFRAHIGIQDEQVQERLLFETLRPVVAG